MQEIKQKINELIERLKKLRGAVNLEEKNKKIEILEGQTQDPNFWNDQEKARSLMQELAGLKKQVEDIKNLSEEIETIKMLSEEESLGEDLKKEVVKTEKFLERLELLAFLSDGYDDKNAIIYIHAGQGGTEAMDWSSMLLRMYLRFCERKGWTAEVIENTPGEEAGVKSVAIRVTGPYAYGYLKGEAGTHRLVRQSPFNADKLRQTSFALVEVLPELSDVDLPDVEIKEEDLDWQFYRASSQGGQNVQKVSTAVRLTHKPTGIIVTSQNERFQEQNRKIALSLLRAKLWLRSKEEAQKTKQEIKGEYRPASWGNQIRSYVLHPYKMVKDLRTEVETGNTEAVLDGEIDEFIDAELKLK